MANQNAATKLKDDKILDLPLKDLHVNFEWNSRGIDPSKATATGDEETSDGKPSADFLNIYQSILARGQDEPVIVRPKGQKYELVVGFTRYAAIRKAYEEKQKIVNLPEGTIRVRVRELNDIEARSLNIRADAGRRGVSALAMMNAVADLHRLYKEAKSSCTQQTLAAETGIGQGYISKLLTVHEKLAPKVMKKWKESPVEIGLNLMSTVAKLDDPEAQEKKFEEVAPKAGSGTGGGPKGDRKTQWLKGLEAKLESIGEFLGRLERLDLIDSSKMDFEEEMVIERLLDVTEIKKGDMVPTENQRAKLIKVVTDAFGKALEYKEPEPKKEEEKK